jgi:hypothetical protein
VGPSVPIQLHITRDSQDDDDLETRDHKFES